MLPRRVLAVDDEPFFLALVARSLTEHGFEVHTATHALEAISKVDTVDPVLVLLDVDLGPGLDGLQVARRVGVTHPSIVVVLLTRFPDPGSLIARRLALPNGGAVLCKSSLETPEKLARALDDLLRGVTFPRRVPPTSPLSGLTRAQVDVLRLAAAGLTNAGIAEARGVTHRAVEYALQGVYERLGLIDDGTANARVNAVRYYIKAAGTVDLETEGAGAPRRSTRA